MNKEEINSRFLQVINTLLERNIAPSKGDIANTLGIKPAKFSEILNKRMNIGVDIAALTCIHYNISADWLLTGRGEMLQYMQHFTGQHSSSEQNYLIDKIALQAEEIGILKQTITQLRKELGDTVSAANGSTIASVG